MPIPARAASLPVSGNPHPKMRARPDGSRTGLADAPFDFHDESETAVATPASRIAPPATPSRRQIFAVAAALAATALTGTAAIAGLTRTTPATPTAPRVGQIITPAAPAPVHRVEPGD